MMESLYQNEQMRHLFVGVVIIVAFGILAGPLRRLFAVITHRLFAKTETVLDDRILSVVLKNLRPLLFAIGLRIALREFRKGNAEGDATLLQIFDYAEALLYVVIAFLLVRILLGIFRELIQWYLERISGEGASNLKDTLGPLTTKVVNVLVGLVGIIIILDHFGVNIGSLLVSLGVGSLAVALAAQDTLANMIAGFVILVDRPFRVGDRIEIGAGVVGDVREIGLRSTRLLMFDNNLLVIPNAELVKSRITNLSYPDPPMRVLLRFDVAYGSDLAPVRTILLDAARSHPDILAAPPPQVAVTKISDTAVELTLVARAKSFALQWGAETALREEVYAMFLRNGIRVPVQRRVVQLQNSQTSAE
jgi:small-conductance mechanosensitive channel